MHTTKYFRRRIIEIHTFYNRKRTILFQTIIRRNINWTSSICININTFPISSNKKGTVITYVDDIFIQTNSYEQMFETLTEYHKILL